MLQFRKIIFTIISEELIKEHVVENESIQVSVIYAYLLKTNFACVHGSTNGTNGIPISFKVLPMVPLVIPLVPMVPLEKTDGRQYNRQSTVWAKLPTLESHMIQYGVLNFKFINFTNKLYFYRDDISK